MVARGSLWRAVGHALPESSYGSIGWLLLPCNVKHCRLTRGALKLCTPLARLTMASCFPSNLWRLPVPRLWCCCDDRHRRRGIPRCHVRRIRNACQRTACLRRVRARSVASGQYTVLRAQGQAHQRALIRVGKKSLH